MPPFLFLGYGLAGEHPARDLRVVLAGLVSAVWAVEAMVVPAADSLVARALVYLVPTSLFLLLWPTALKRFSFGGNFAEVFRAAFGVFPSGEPPGFGEYQLPWNGLVAMWALHGFNSTA